MQRLCQKPYCELPSIPRGKYCEIHRIKKRTKRSDSDTEINFNNLRISEERKELESFRKQEEKEKLEEDRKLRREQEEEFQKTMEADRERLEQLEYEKILKLSEDKYFEDLKEKISLNTTCLGSDFYNIKIQMPNGTKINGKFSIKSTVQDVREYINLYIYENNIRISNYDLILNFPHRKITVEEKDLNIQSLSKAKNFILYLSDLDA